MKLSIIVPVHNLEDYISTSLDSLLSIRFSHKYEIIVVNDGSTDASEAVILDYQKKTNKIRLITIENGGVANARNVGIQQAAGQYITFLDGDDTIDPDFFEKAVAELDRGGYDFVQGNYRMVYDDHVEPLEFVKQDIEITDRKQMMELILDRDNRQICCSVWGKVYQGKIVRQLRFNPLLTIAEDWEYNLDVIRTANRIKLLHDMSVDYIQRGTSLVHTMNGSKALDKLAVSEYFLENNPYPELTRIIEKDYIPHIHEAYYLLSMDADPRAKELHRKLLHYPLREVWPMLDRDTRKSLLLHRFAGPVYDFYFRHIKKNG